MDRRKFIKTTMCLGCAAVMSSVSQKYLLSDISYKLSKDKFIYKRKADLPKKVYIEACSLCQLNCPACVTRLHENIIKSRTSDGFGYLKFNDFKNFVDDNPQIELIELSNNGEIFLNPELDKIIEYGYKKNVKLTAEHGVHLNELSDEMAEKLVKYRFSRMNVAIDGATSETYAIYRRGGDYNKVIENIKKINHYKKIYNSEYPELIWQFVVFGHNENEIELAAEKAKELNMRIYYKENYIKDYSPIRNKDRVYKLTGICSDENFDIKNIRKYNWHLCDILFETPKIDWDGSLHGCWQLYKQKQTFGVNVFKVGLLNALNSRMFVEAKHMLTDVSYKSKINTPCTNCYYYIYFLKKRNYSISKYA